MDNIPNDGFLRRIDVLNEEVVVVTKPSLVAEFLQQRADDYEEAYPIRRIHLNRFEPGDVSAEDYYHRVFSSLPVSIFTHRTKDPTQSASTNL